MSNDLLPPEVLQELEAVAHAENRSVADVVNEMIREYVARRHDEKISEESVRFREQHARLFAEYAGQYIAMRAGEVLDHDADLGALHGRVRGQLGNAPILFTLV